jgi:hypothetical protein
LAKTLVAKTLGQFLGVEMLDRRQRAEHRGVEDQDVEARPALGDGLASLAILLAVGEVERGDRRASAGGVDLLLDLLRAPTRCAR